MVGALQRYRVVAWIVGVLLVALFCVGMPLKYIGDVDEVSKYVGLVHGMGFYPLYLLLTFDLARRTHMPMRRTALTMLAGTVPFVSFYAERRTSEWVAEHAAATTA